MPAALCPDRPTAARARVAAYLRVSTDGQADNGCSLDAQRAKAEAYAALYDLDLVALVEDRGASGKTLDRPGLRRALDLLDQGQADGLLVAKLDRLTRSVRDLATLLDRGFRERWALLSVAEQVDTRSAAGRLVLNVLCSVAEWERETIGERTREALRHLKRSGAQLGGEALGWRRSAERDESGRRVVEHDPEEALTVSRVLELREQGESLRGVCRILEAEGRPTKRGGAWRPSTVQRVLARHGLR